LRICCEYGMMLEGGNPVKTKNEDFEKQLEDLGAEVVTGGEEHIDGDFVWWENHSSKGTVGVSAQFNDHGYICEEVDCLHRDPLGIGSKYKFKQGKWF